MTGTEKFSKVADASEQDSVRKARHSLIHFMDQPLLRQLFDAIPDVVIVLNNERRIVFSNRALLSWLDTPEEDELYGLRPGEALNCVHAFETEGGCGSTEFCTTCGAAQAVISGLRGLEAVEECRILRRSGEALDLRVWTTPLQIDDEQLIVLTIKDISHEKRRQALERIFFHDLLNVAASLQGFAQLLQTSVSVTELEEIKQSIATLSSRLVEEINAQRELVAAENKELPVYPAPVNSLELIREVVDVYWGYPETQDRHLKIVPTARSIWFVSDKVLIGRVIGNMVKNALEASWPGETVTLDCTVPNGEVVFSVHNPNYMPRQVQLQVFQRSFSTRGAGRGLGTYSIKLLTERYLNGRVSFTSSPTGGTTFTARLPLKLKGFDSGESFDED